MFRNAVMKAGRAKVETEHRGGFSGPKHGRNSTYITDAKLVAIITTHASEASKHSKLAGEGSISALRRYYEIGAKLLEQKELGKFKKPNLSIKDFCNRHLIGVIGDKNPYKMVGHSMTLAKPGKNGRPGLWEALLSHADAMAAAGTPIGPTGINAGLTLARRLIRGDVSERDKPKSDEPDRLEDAVARLKGLHELVIDMLAAVPPDRAGEFADRLSQLMPPWALPIQRWHTSDQNLNFCRTLAA